MPEAPIHVAVILGSTRPNRHSADVARWVLERAALRPDLDVESIDLAEVDLPIYDEPMPPIMGDYAHEHTREWAARIAGFDAFVFVTPEYNRSIPAVLKNAIDYLYAEWTDKAAGFVSYGADAGGARAIEHLRVVLGELRVADVRTMVPLSLVHDFEGFTRFTPARRWSRRPTRCSPRSRPGAGDARRASRGGGGARRLRLTYSPGGWRATKPEVSVGARCQRGPVPRASPTVSQRRPAISMKVWPAFA